ncbi:MAG: type II toxin-antitoxin system PemK/MazF family toxin [Armatimonadetes bacterium]|nr:type II toxin-antitoxin system PemK/MazF family toxin [Armatimonadota bacterium]
MLLWVALGRRLPPGHEQEGERPALLVGVPAKLGRPRFSMLLVAPVTSCHRQPWAQAAPRLYPRLEAGVANLPRASLVLLDQLQTLDARRVLRHLGDLSETQYAPIAEGLATLLART